MPWRHSAIFFRNRADVAKASQANHCRAVWSTPDTRLVKWPLQPTTTIKGKPFTQNRRHKSLISVRARHHHCSCSTPVRSWPPCHQSISPICSVPRQASCSSVFVHDVEKKLGSRPEAGLEPRWHPWLSPRKSLSRFAGRWCGCTSVLQAESVCY
jgi:hypothetical protein